jgi:hypothetical protein
MSSLHEIQRAFRVALLGGSDGAAVDGIVADGLAPAARLAIYRHHVSVTLTEVLQAAYPVVCRLVDERFFGYAADRFIATHPPTSPCLSEYGEAFATFLDAFEPCRDLVYLPDVARLEWAMHRALHADDATALDPRAPVELTSAELNGMRLRFHPSLTLLDSPWPIDRMWRANQPDSDPEAVVDLCAGGARLEVRRHEDAVVFRALEAGPYTLRRALHAGRTLGAAVAAALSDDPDLALATTLRDLFGDDGLVAFTLTTPSEEERS